MATSADDQGAFALDRLPLQGNFTASAGAANRYGIVASYLVDTAIVTP